jgi:hypothetical protein
MSEFDHIVIKRFTTHFGPPATSDPRGLVADYRRELGSIPMEILRAAIDLVVRQHKFRFWPTIAEVLEAVAKVKADRERHNEWRAQQTYVLEDPPTRSPEEKARVAAMVAATVEQLRKANRKPRTLPRTDREAWEARHGRPARSHSNDGPSF